MHVNIFNMLKKKIKKQLSRIKSKTSNLNNSFFIVNTF